MGVSGFIQSYDVRPTTQAKDDGEKSWVLLMSKAG